MLKAATAERSRTSTKQLTRYTGHVDAVTSVIGNGKPRHAPDTTLYQGVVAIAAPLLKQGLAQAGMEGSLCVGLDAYRGLGCQLVVEMDI